MRPRPEPHQMHPQLSDLLAGGPIPRTRHGTGRDAIDKRDDRSGNIRAQPRWPLPGFRPVFAQATLKESPVFTVHPGVEALQLRVSRELPPEGDPEGALGPPLSVDRQRFAQHAEQVGVRGAGALRKPQFDAPQDQPQCREDDLLLGFKIVRDHAGGVPGGAGNVRDGSLCKSTSRNGLAGDQRDFIASLGMIDYLGQGSIPAGRLTDGPTELRGGRFGGLCGANLLERITNFGRRRFAPPGGHPDVQVHLFACGDEVVIGGAM